MLMLCMHCIALWSFKMILVIIVIQSYIAKVFWENSAPNKILTQAFEISNPITSP